MRHFRLWTVLLLVAALLGGVARSQSDEVPADMARWLPPVDLFAVAPVSSETLDDFDALMLSFTGLLPEEIATPFTLRQVVNRFFAPSSDIDIVSLAEPWLGDYIALGIDGLDLLLDDDLSNDDQVVFYFAVQITNRLLATGAISLTGIADNTTRESRDGYTFFSDGDNNRAFAINDTILLAAIGTTTIPLNPAPALADSAEFTGAISELPFEDYLMLVYETKSVLLRRAGVDAGVRDLLSALGLHVDHLGGTVAGFTILDDRSLVMDLVQLRSEGGSQLVQAINPVLTQRLPATSSLVIQAANPAYLLQTLSGLIASISVSDTPDSIYLRLQNLTRLLLDMDLDQDILSWANGDYAIFLDPAEPLQLGVVLETTDIIQAQALIDAVAGAMIRMAEQTTTEIDTIINRDGVAVKVTRVVIPDLENENNEPVILVMGVDGNLLFVASEMAAQTLLTTDTHLSDFDVYQEAAGYFLPDSNVALYIEGRAPGELFGLATVMFEPLNALFVNAPVTLDSASAVAQRVPDVVRSSSISLAGNDHHSLMIRVVLTMQPE